MNSSVRITQEIIWMKLKRIGVNSLLSSKFYKVYCTLTLIDENFKCAHYFNCYRFSLRSGFDADCFDMQGRFLGRIRVGQQLLVLLFMQVRSRFRLVWQRNCWLYGVLFSLLRALKREEMRCFGCLKMTKFFPSTLFTNYWQVSIFGLVEFLVLIGN